MTRKLKALGLALVAVFAMSAIAAQGAMAVDHTFTSSVSPTVLTGAQTTANRAKFQGLALECTTAVFSGTMVNKFENTVTVHPTYSGCKFAGMEATVATTGCNYVLGSDTTSSSDLTGEHASVSVECGHSSQIVVSIAGICTITIGDTHPPSTTTVNQGLHGVTYAVAGGELTVTATIKTTKYVVEGGLCFLGGLETGTFADGEVTGVVKFAGFVDGNGPFGTPDADQYNEGAQATLGLTTP